MGNLFLKYFLDNLWSGKLIKGVFSKSWISFFKVLTIVRMAEREGFEPSVELSPHTRLAGERLQPARPSLRIFFLIWMRAEGVGFEPTEL